MVDVCAKIVKFNCISMESHDAKNGSAMVTAATIASNANTE